MRNKNKIKKKMKVSCGIYFKIVKVNLKVFHYIKISKIKIEMKAILILKIIRNLLIGSSPEINFRHNKLIYLLTEIIKKIIARLKNYSR